MGTYSHIESKYWTRDFDERSSLPEPSETWIQVLQGIESLVPHTLAFGHSQVHYQIEDHLPKQSLNDYWGFGIL